MFECPQLPILFFNANNTHYLQIEQKSLLLMFYILLCNLRFRRTQLRRNNFFDNRSVTEQACHLSDDIALWQRAIKNHRYLNNAPDTKCTS